jgi:hypothetical protein
MTTTFGLTLQQSCEDILGRSGKLISASKGQYSWDNPENFVVFNANIVNAEGKKVWYGDIDITKQLDELIFISGQALGQEFYILPEMAARFENEQQPKLDEYLVKVKGTTVEVSPTMLPYVAVEKDSHGEVRALKLLPREKPAELAKLDYAEEDYQVLTTLTPEERADIVEHEGEEFLEFANYFDIKDCFANMTSESGPLHNFWDMARKFIELSELDSSDLISSVIITEEDSDSLRTQLEYWTRVFHPHLTEYQIKRDISFLWLGYGPNNFQGTPYWAEPGKMYVKKRK